MPSPDCGAPPPDPNNPAEVAAFLAATQWMMGTRADVDKLAGMAREMIESEVRDKSTGLLPQLFVLTRRRPDEDAARVVHAIAAPFNTTAEKGSILRRLAVALYEGQQVPLAAALVAEAWTTTRPAGAPHVEPRLDPNRTECLIATVANNAALAGPGGIGAATRLIRLPVSRDRKGLFVAAGPLYDTAEDAAATFNLSALLRVFFLAYVKCCITSEAGRQAAAAAQAAQASRAESN